MIMKGPYRFINYKKCTIRWGMMTREEAELCVWGGGGCIRNHYNFSQFCCEPKTAPPPKVYFFKALENYQFCCNGVASNPPRFSPDN